MTPKDIERKASELGLQQVAQRYPDELKKVLENSVALADRIPKNIHWTEEPAHTIDLRPRRDVRS